MAYYHFGVLGPPLVQVVPDITETVEFRNITAMCKVTVCRRRSGWVRCDHNGLKRLPEAPLIC